jgi:hypothetical protein
MRLNKRLEKKFPSMGIDRLFGKQKLPHALFSNYPNDICPPLCDEHGNVIKFKRLTTTRPCKAFGFFEFVIRQSEPYSIYTFHYKKRKSYDDYSNMDKVYNCKTMKQRDMHHNCIARNENVISAGGLYFSPDSKSRSVIITNESGHYFPSKESIDHVIHILKDLLGYTVEAVQLS